MLGKQMAITQHPTEINIPCIYLYHHFNVIKDNFNGSKLDLLPEGKVRNLNLKKKNCKICFPLYK